MFLSPGTLAPVSSDVLVHLNSNGSSSGVSRALVEPQLVLVEGWNSVKQVVAFLGLYAATFLVLDATASPACLFAASALPVAVGGSGESASEAFLDRLLKAFSVHSMICPSCGQS